MIINKTLKNRRGILTSSFILLLTLIMNSCVNYTEIMINRNGIHDVKCINDSYIYYNLAKVKHRYSNSLVISNLHIDTNYLTLQYNISSVDSLNQYLGVYSDGFLNFDLDSNILKVSTSAKYPFREELSFTSFQIKLKFEQEIVSIQKENCKLKWKKKDNEIWFRIKGKRAIKGEKRINIEIELDN